MSNRGTRLAGAAIVAQAVALLAACGGGDDASPVPTTAQAPSTVSATTENTSSAASATSPARTSSRPALSPHEREPQVVALRAFGAQYGRAVNANSSAYAPWHRTMSRGGQKIAPKFITNDLKLDEVYPGPLPFTPVKIYEQGGNQLVNACVWSHGWGVHPKTRAAAEKKVIEPMFFQLSKVKGEWKVDTAGAYKAFSCDNVRVEGRPW